MNPSRDPFDRFDRIRRMIENMPNFAADPRSGNQSMMNTYVDQSVDKQRGVLSVVMDIPGVSEDDISAKVYEEHGRQWITIEASRQTDNTMRRFRQQIPLGRKVDAELADSEYNNGVLTVEFPLVDEDDSGVNIQLN